MKRTFSATVWQEGDWFVAQCLEIDVASQSASEEEALINLRKALELHLAPPSGNPKPRIREIEVEIGAA